MLRTARSIAALLALLPLPVLAGDPAGTWATRPNDKGNRLEVTLAACPGAPGTLCGMITKARNAAGEEIPSAFVGKAMILNMAPDGTDRWSGGTIWAPDDDETYASRMELNGETLTVKGCVAAGLICRGQDWTRVK